MSNQQVAILRAQCVVCHFVLTGEQPIRQYLTVCDIHSDKTHRETRNFFNETVVA